MTAIKSVQIEGYRSLRAVHLQDLARLNVLIGPNGAGKSNLVSFLQMVPIINTQSLRAFVGGAGGASALLHYGPKVTPAFEFKLEFEQDLGMNAYCARLGFAAGDTLIFMDEQVGYKGPHAQDYRWTSLGAGHAESLLAEKVRTDKTAQTTRWVLNRVNFYHVHDTSPTAPIRRPSRVEDCRFLRSDGSNLAAFLLALKRSDREEFRASWRRILGLVKKVAPFIKDIVPTPTNGVGPDGALPGADEELPPRSQIRLDWIDERDQVFSCDYFSDGTLRALALITALGQPSSMLPLFIAIDEPELGLHPAALNLLVGLARSVSDRCQVLLATQSPALLDMVEPEEVLVVERQDGATAFRRLEREPLTAWLDDYTLSELFDKNVLGGRP